MLAKLSLEGQIVERMHEIHILAHELADIAPVVGRTRLSQALNGSKPLHPEDARKLLDFLSRLKELQNEFPEHLREISRINWADKEKIQRALVLRLANGVLVEQGDNSFSEAARKATEAVVG